MNSSLQSMLRREIEKNEKRKERKKENKKKAKDHFDNGNRMYQEGGDENIEKAIEEYRKSMNLDPDLFFVGENPASDIGYSAYEMKGYCHVQRVEYHLAPKEFKKALDLNEKNSNHYRDNYINYSIGFCFYRRKMYKKAFRFFTKSIDSTGEPTPKAYYYRAAITAQGKLHDESVSDFVSFLEKSTNKGYATEKEISNIEEAIKPFPNQPYMSKLYHKIGEFYERNGNMMKARENYSLSVQNVIHLQENRESRTFALNSLNKFERNIYDLQHTVGMNLEKIEKLNTENEDLRNKYNRVKRSIEDVRRIKEKREKKKKKKKKKKSRKKKKRSGQKRKRDQVKKEEGEDEGDEDPRPLKKRKLDHIPAPGNNGDNNEPSGIDGPFPERVVTFDDRD